MVAASGAVATSKARRSGLSPIFGGEFFAESTKPERVVGERIAERGAQQVGTLEIVQRLEFLPAVAIKQLDLLGSLAPAFGGPEGVGAHADGLRVVHAGQDVDGHVVAADVVQRTRLHEKALIAQFIGNLGGAG